MYRYKTENFTEIDSDLFYEILDTLNWVKDEEYYLLVSTNEKIGYYDKEKFFINPKFYR